MARKYTRRPLKVKPDLLRTRRLLSSRPRVKPVKRKIASQTAGMPGAKRM